MVFGSEKKNCDGYKWYFNNFRSKNFSCKATRLFFLPVTAGAPSVQILPNLNQSSLTFFFPLSATFSTNFLSSLNKCEAAVWNKMDRGQAIPLIIAVVQCFFYFFLFFFFNTLNNNRQLCSVSIIAASLGGEQKKKKNHLHESVKD